MREKNRYLLCYVILKKVFDKIKESDIILEKSEKWALHTSLCILLERYIVTKKRKKD